MYVAVVVLVNEEYIQHIEGYTLGQDVASTESNKMLTRGKVLDTYQHPTRSNV